MYNALSVAALHSQDPNTEAGGTEIGPEGETARLGAAFHAAGWAEILTNKPP